ncbi:MFS transporter [Paenibacillus sp. GYB004]|uniref:MFS transporter n=1 Tax=Paenibacillus sp. GYB004 TaxID=2994393 RepID=UPI002F96A3BC
MKNHSIASAANFPRYWPLIFAVASGMSVANIYYAQPLLEAISIDLSMPASTIGIVVTVTQIFYAFGLALLVPLGDLVNRRKLIISQLLLSAAALAAVGFSPSGITLLASMAVVGLLAVITQTLVAFASTLASPAERGRVVGLVTSGIVIGILLARTFAGIVSDLGGWRAVYWSSAVVTLLMVGLLSRILPRNEAVAVPASLSYGQLLKSLFRLFVEERILQIRGVLALLIFTAFSTLWTSLVLPLSEPHYSLSNTQIGLFGLFGVAGALAAVQAGRLADRGRGQRTTGVALALLLVSWLPISFTDQSLIALIIGIIVLDLAVQAVHVTNQSLIFAKKPEARSRLTGGYMIFYSIGSALGSIASTYLYAHYGWYAVCLLGAGVSALALGFWWMTRRMTAS